jgi:nicotinamide mononucleotide transporter
MEFFDIKNIAFYISGHPISYLELVEMLFGLVSVYFASKANILTWSTGLVNEILMFVIFFQVQLYADMFLQIYFFFVTIFGWYRWKAKSLDNKITEISTKTMVITLISILIGTVLFGLFLSKIHLYLPHYFKIPATYPFTDSFVMALSVVATAMLAKKIMENWYLWLVADVVCVILYFQKEIYLLSLEYFISVGLSFYGIHLWKKQLKITEKVQI